ncbi:hypothetical protein GUY60_19585 [Streptomyces sp. YC537]|uniref:Secreted protein n=1 Tax=Streptomyces boluensis TaxID=1775135 RepID=A0A964XMW2_9ACTN|nr:hypothetical protein [Streptomyces boluensis]
MSNSVVVKRVGAAVAAAAAAFAFGVGTVGASGDAVARISPVDTSCTNNGGHEPGGQQPTCNNDGGLTQESENQNPAGHAPGGHNKG